MTGIACRNIIYSDKEDIVCLCSAAVVMAKGCTCILWGLQGTNYIGGTYTILYE